MKVLGKEINIKKLNSELDRLNNALVKQKKATRQVKNELKTVKHTVDVTNDELEKFRTTFYRGHFYSPEPDLKEIKKRSKKLFDRSKRDIPGIDIREKSQVKLLDEFKSHAKKINFSDTKDDKSSKRYFFENTAYSYTDGSVLFCMLMHLKPKKIIEIGSGYSSALMLDVNEEYFDRKMKLTFIEPYPELLLSLMKPEDKDSYELIDSNLSEVKSSVFDTLESGDILFVDSTHVSKIGSDVNQIFFDILPNLKKGVIVHVHDVFYPFEYPEEWIYEGRAWTEDYLLRAFLHNNEDYEIIFFNNFMNIHNEPAMKKVIPDSIKCSGGSIWLKKVR